MPLSLTILRRAVGSLLLSCFLLLLASPLAWGQDKFIRPISFLEGLPTQTIYDIHQGPKGYLYLGTDIGVFQYNGQNFLKLPAPESWDNNFDNLLHDEAGNLWVKNFANQIFTFNNGTLQSVHSVQKVLKNYGGLKKFTIQNNCLFAAMDNTLLKIDLTKDFATTILSSKGQENAFYSLHEYQDRVYFNNNQSIINQEGVVQYQSPEGWRLLEFTFFNDEVYGLNRSLEGEIFNISTKQMVDKSQLPQGTYLYFFREVEGDLYICTNKGLFTIDTEMLSVTGSLLHGMRVSDVIQDREGNLWISTLDDGLFFIANAPLYTTELINFRSENRNNILSLALSNNNTLLSGNNKGRIFSVDQDGKILQSYQSQLQNEVEFIYFDSLTSTVFHTQGYFDYPKGSKLEEIYLSKKITPDDEGNFMVATSLGAGLIAQDLKSPPSVRMGDKFPLTIFSTTAIPFYFILEKRTKTVHYSRKYQRYYFGSAEGLFAFDKNGQTYDFFPDDATPLIVNSMTEDSQGKIWVGSQQKGLLAIEGDEIKKVIPIYVDGNVVPVKKVRISGDNIYLIGGNQLFHYHIPSQHLQLLPISSMFKGINLNDLKIWKDKIWLATSEGLLWTDLSMDIQTVNPNIYLRRISSNEQVISLDQKLPYNLENLEFQFDVLHFKSMGSFNLQFRTNPNQENWQTLALGQNTIIFAGLNSGNYQLEVRALIEDTISESIFVNFVVETPFWKTWWFIAGSLVMVALGIFGYLTSYRKKVQEKETLKSKLLESQLKALRSQMNPHFLFNVVNAVQGLIFTNKKQDAAQYLGQFSDLMRKVLQQSDKQFVRLEEEIQLIDLYISLEKRRFEEEFEYLLAVDSRLEKNLIQIPSLIIQPFVENAVKHGLLHQSGKRKLSLMFQLDTDEKHVNVIIEDNGVGRKASTEINSKRSGHQAFATKAIENRVNLLNQSLADPITSSIEDLTNEQGEGIGTKVTLRLPFTYEYSHTS
ncbi:MAG: sensor histidine kinase [Mongoliitalea sp.]